MNKDLIAVIGATASGKTRYGVELAYKLNGEIISADSRQLYRGMDIGTGKDLEEYSYKGVDIPYHLIDIVNAGERYDLFQYQRAFHKVYNEIKERGRQPILVGGSGLYIEAVTAGYSLPKVEPNPKLRAELEAMSHHQLIERLKELKTLHNRSDCDSKKRTIRAIEVAMAEGAESVTFPPISTKFIGISVSREERRERISRRLKRRFEEGMVEEVEGLLKGGISPEQLIYYGLEYKFITLYLTQEISYKQMYSSLESAIHQFAKRQMTWFRRMERKGVEIEWIEF